MQTDNDRLSFRAVLDIVGIDSESSKKLCSIIEFDGPRAAHCFGVPYIALTQWGVKKEGECAPLIGQEPHWTKDQAIWHWHRTFWDWLILNALDKSQLAWSERPNLKQYEDGAWLVYARLAVA